MSIDFMNPMPEVMDSYWKKDIQTRPSFYPKVKIQLLEPSAPETISDEIDDPSIEGIDGVVDVGDIQEGSGVITDSLKAIIATVRKAKGVIKAVDFLVTGPIGTAVANAAQKAFGRNPLARPKFSGERHAVLSSPWGAVISSYAGPGTMVLKRLRRGDEGVDPDRNGSYHNSLDQAAKRHDILYSLATTMKQIRVADELFVKDVKKSNQPELLKKIIMSLFKLKILGENVNIGIPGISDPVGARLKKADRDLLMKALRDTNISLGNKELEGLTKNIEILQTPLLDDEGIQIELSGSGKAKTRGGSAGDFAGFTPTGSGSAVQVARGITSKMTAHSKVKSAISAGLKGAGSVRQRAAGTHLPGSGLKLPGNPPPPPRGRGIAEDIKRFSKISKTVLRGAEKGVDDLAIPVASLIRSIKMKKHPIPISPFKTFPQKRKGKKKGGRQDGGQFGLIAGLVASEVIPLIIKSLKKKKKKK